MNASKPLRPFLILWSGQALSLIGSAVVQFALVWWLTQETGSATILATASLVGFLPQVLLGPFAGVLVDRWSRRWTMLLADSVIALATLLLAYLFWTETIQIWHVFALLFVRSLGGTFHFPAMQSSTSLMVPHEHLTRIQSFNQMLEGGLGIVAAPLGALLLAFLPMQGILAVDVVTALFAIIPLLFIAVPQPEQMVQGKLGRRLDRYLSRITPFGFAGAALLAKDDRIVLNKGYGLANRADEVPNTTKTVFSTGSISKQFTAAAIMKLEMQGKLHTSDPLSKFFPGVPADKANITLHQLLTHTAGIINYSGEDFVMADKEETVLICLITLIR